MAWTISILSLLAAAGVVLWPRYGLLALWKVVQAHQQRVQREDALKHLQESPAPTLQSVAGALHLSVEKAARVLDDLEAHRLIRWQEGKITLTPTGKEYALQVIRAHRLWERYLAERTGYPQDDWHRQAESAEHRLSPDKLDALAAQLGHPRYDPHGDPIPTSEGRLRPLEGQALSTLLPNQSAHIIHLEDEPPGIYRHLTETGLHVGQHIQVTRRDEGGIHFQADGRAHTLTHLQAESVSVQPAENTQPPPARTLAQVPLGESAHIAGLSTACQGPERRRLLDLGFVPGTQVRVVMQSPGGRDLRAYEVRGAMIALRRNQAEMLLVSDSQPTTAVPEPRQENHDSNQT